MLGILRAGAGVLDVVGRGAAIGVVFVVLRVWRLLLLKGLVTAPNAGMVAPLESMLMAMDDCGAAETGPYGAFRSVLKLLPRLFGLLAELKSPVFVNMMSWQRERGAIVC
jgi:hypothetical protein